MDVLQIIEKYYTPGTQLYDLLIKHSSSVAERAIQIAESGRAGDVDKNLIYEAAMLHDIGIYQTDAPKIYCFGAQPYICHAWIGAEILRKEGLPRHAEICEKHTGAGISTDDIKAQNLPLPQRDMIPSTPEEEIVALSDKFYSKSKPDKIFTIEEVRKSLSCFGEGPLSRFDGWVKKYIG